MLDLGPIFIIHIHINNDNGPFKPIMVKNRKYHNELNNTEATTEYYITK